MRGVANDADDNAIYRSQLSENPLRPSMEGMQRQQEARKNVS